MRKISFSNAINEALIEEMRKDEKVIIFGEDVAVHGGIFGVTKGILNEFGPNRIKDTPISETAIVGGGLGAALTGLRPVIEIMYGDFLLVAFNEVFHNVAKWRYLHGGEYDVPLVIRCAEGYSFGAGGEHSNCLGSLFMHAPGLKIVVPSTPYDAKGLLKAAIKDNNPVLYFEHKQLYQQKGEVPEEDYIIPIGKAEIRRNGKDITILAISLMVQRALSAAEELSKQGIEVEVIDPRTLSPLDKETIYNSVKKTHRLIIVEEGNLTCGIGSEISSLVQEELFDYLDGPVRRLASLDVPLPYNLKLEDYVIPKAEQIIEIVKSFF